MPRARSSTAKLSKAFDGATAPLCLIDAERRILFVNASLADWLDVSADDLIGTTCAYHSQSDAQTPDAIADRLCPPPQVFFGQKATAVIPGPPNTTSRIFEFLPICDDSGEVQLVLAAALPLDTTAAPPPDDDVTALHDLVRRFRHSQATRFRVDRLIGRSPQIVKARRQVALAVDSAASVFIVGPPGSGKEHVARTIHYRGGDPWGPLVPLACATLSADLLVSTLAAAVKSHPRSPAAKNPTGTLLLTDLDQLPLDVHSEVARLLIREGTSLRLIATACRAPAQWATDSASMQELVCLLGTIEIALPALADRLVDLPILAQVFLEDMNARGAKQVSTFQPEVLDILATHHWKGNLDALQAVVSKAHARATGPYIIEQNLPEEIHLAREATARGKTKDETLDLEAFLMRVERELISRALARAKGNKARAARLLGMTRPKLYRRLVQLKMPIDDSPAGGES